MAPIFWPSRIKAVEKLKSKPTLSGIGVKFGLEVLGCLDGGSKQKD